MKVFLNIFINLNIYTFSYYLVYYLSRDKLELDQLSLEYFGIYLSSWLLGSLLSGKFVKSYDTFWEASRVHITSIIIMLALISLSVNLFELQEISRKIVIGSLLVSVFVEFIVVRIRASSKGKLDNLIHIDFNAASFLRELILYIVVLFLNYVLFYEGKFLQDENLLIIFGVFIAWIIGAVYSLQFVPFDFSINYFRLAWKYLKSYIILNILSAFFVFSLRIEFDTQLFYIYFVLSYSILSFLIVTFIYLYKKPASSDEVKFKLARATDATEISKLEQNFNGFEEYKFTENPNGSTSLSEKLQKVYLKKFPRLFEFISSTITLESIDDIRAVVLRSADPYNVEVLPEEEIQFYLNLHEINDMRRLNQYLIEINKRLQRGGIYISKLEPIRNRHKRFKEKYPYYFAQMFYFIDFLWRRVSPKIPVIQKIYFALTKGRNRALSLAEGLGRLYYCGFEIINITEIDNFVYFITKKINEPSDDVNPSYGPFFKMRRIGKDGKPFFVYKLRTMHPYAEYLQPFVYQHFNLQDGGKFKDDFRISYWGKIFRKLWIDELPMFINFFRGELKIVGVRPLSNHYLSLYSEQLKDLRFKSKPGLVPPFYADMPRTLDEIMLSEENYLKQYFKSPLTTDVKYFFRAFHNIVFKKARSG